MKPVAVYRCFDASGALLYVGVSVAPIARLTEHKAGSPWAQTSATIIVEWWPDKASALAAETKAINQEKPRHNRSGRAIRKSLKRLGCGADNSALIERIKDAIAATGETQSAFGKRAVNDFGLMQRLRVGSQLQPSTIARIEAALLVAA
jgi:predicted GIY-YIG superfamily endonuclease